MRFDTDLHRRTIALSNRVAHGKPLEISVIDAGPQQGDRHAAPTMLFIHGIGGRAAYWEYQLEQFQIDYRGIALDLRAIACGRPLAVARAARHVDGCAKYRFMPASMRPGFIDPRMSSTCKIRRRKFGKSLKKSRAVV